MNSYRYLLLIPLILFIGCSGDSRPSDLPPLFPCIISVTQAGTPLEGAYVELVSPGQTYRPSATTDASGKATMLTYGYPGAPKGTYKILVRKGIEDDIVYGTDEYGEQVVASSNTYHLVDAKYANAEQTPHEVEVATKKTEKTVDVGEPVRVRVQGSY